MRNPRIRIWSREITALATLRLLRVQPIDPVASAQPHFRDPRKAAACDCPRTYRLKTLAPEDEIRQPVACRAGRQQFGLVPVVPHDKPTSHPQCVVQLFRW